MYLVGFDSKYNGGMWVWWLDCEVMDQVNRKFPKQMIRKPTPEEAELMSRLGDKYEEGQLSEQDRADAKRLMELLGNATS